MASCLHAALSASAGCYCQNHRGPTAAAEIERREQPGLATAVEHSERERATAEAEDAARAGRTALRLQTLSNVVSLIEHEPATAKHMTGAPDRLPAPHA